MEHAQVEHLAPKSVEAKDPGSLELSGLGLVQGESLGDSRICIAVLDGMVDLSHSCFRGAQIQQISDLLPADAEPGATSDHGTHVASIIFGQPQSPFLGIAPRCRGIVIPIFHDYNGRQAVCTQVDLARAITMAVQHGAQIINISAGQFAHTPEAEPLLAQAVRQCAENGTVIVAAAGNDGCECLHFPAALPSVMAVGAVDHQGHPLDFSNWGKAYRTRGILAPGQAIPGAAPSGGLAQRSGTSFAAPIVSGTMGLLMSVQAARGLEPDARAAGDYLFLSADTCNPQEFSDCRRFLAGRLNIAGAYAQIPKGGPSLSRTSGPKDQVPLSNERPLKEAMADTGEAAQTPAMATNDPNGEPTIAVGTSQHQEGGKSIMTDSNRESGTQNEVSAVESSQAQEVRETAEDSKAQAVQESAESPAVETNAPLGEGFEVSQAATRVWPSGACGCGPVTLVYALGALGLDYGTEARQDSIVQSMGSSNPADAYDPTKILAHLNEKPYESAAVIWTLTMESTPIYALLPEGPYADTTYDRLREFLGDQINAGVERVSIPGKISGGVRLMSGQVVPVIAPQVRGMYSWGTDALITSVCGEAPKSGKDRDAYNQKASGIRNFLQRVYFELNNLGISPQDRAMNFAATNAFQISTVFQQAIGENMVLDKIAVEKSPICRPMSDCWEVKLIFFDPTRRFETARKLYRFTIDVSDIVPATIGQVRSWSVY